jgi:membrane protease YdiL (CAAX protease family)
MTEIQTELQPLAQTPPQRRWPLPFTLTIDLLIVIVGWLGATVVISMAFITIRAQAQGLNLSQLSALSPDEQLQLLGVTGIFVMLLVQNIFFAGVPVLRVALLERASLAALGFRSDRPLYHIGFGVLLGIGVLFGNLVCGLFFQLLGIQQNQAAQFPLYQGDYGGQFLFLIGAAVLAPIGEEILCRGYLFHRIAQEYQLQRWGRPVAYLVSSLLFSLAHSASASEGLIALLVPTFLMGLVLAWGFSRSQSVIPPIIAHAMNNGVALLALLVCVNNPGLEGCPAL